MLKMFYSPYPRILLMLKMFYSPYPRILLIKMIYSPYSRILLIKMIYSPYPKKVGLYSFLLRAPFELHPLLEQLSIPFPLLRLQPV